MGQVSDRLVLVLEYVVEKSLSFLVSVVLDVLPVEGLEVEGEEEDWIFGLEESLLELVLSAATSLRILEAGSALLVVDDGLAVYDEVAGRYSLGCLYDLRESLRVVDELLVYDPECLVVFFDEFNPCAVSSPGLDRIDLNFQFCGVEVVIQDLLVASLS